MIKQSLTEITSQWAVKGKMDHMGHQTNIAYFLLKQEGHIQAHNVLLRFPG